MGIQDVLRNHPAVGGLVGGAVLGAGSFGIINIIRGGRKKRLHGRKQRREERLLQGEKLEGKLRNVLGAHFKEGELRRLEGLHLRKYILPKMDNPTLSSKTGKQDLLKNPPQNLEEKEKAGSHE